MSDLEIEYLQFQSCNKGPIFIFCFFHVQKKNFSSRPSCWLHRLRSLGMASQSRRETGLITDGTDD